MSQTINKGVPHKILVKNKNPGTISTGANTEVYIDGQPLKGVSFLKLEFKPAKVTKITIEMYAEVEVETDAVFEPEVTNENLMKLGKKIYTIGRYESAGVALPVKPKSDSDIVDPVSNNVD